MHQTPFGVYLLSRHADAAAVVRDPRLSNNQENSELFQAFAEANPPSDDGMDQMNSVVMLFMDPPDHSRLRGLVSKAFTPKMVERLRSRVQQIVDERLDAVEARGDGRMDVVTELAYPLPVVIICELLGVPPEDHATFSSWSSELAASIDPDPLITPEQQVRINAAGDAFLQYFSDADRAATAVTPATTSCRRSSRPRRAATASARRSCSGRPSSSSSPGTRRP